MAYSEVEDLLNGSIPLPAYLSPQKYVDDGADEIDSKIGFVYETPVDTSAPDFPRPTKLLLKRVNNFLATGRLLMAVASPGEDNEVHAYGLYLVKQAEECLEYILSGGITLDGAILLPQEDQVASGPLIANKDVESNVDAFYDRITNPDWVVNPNSIFSPVRTLW